MGNMDKLFGDVLSFADAAAYLGVTPDTIQAYTKREVDPIPTIRINSKTIRILKTDLLYWLIQNKVEDEKV